MTAIEGRLVTMSPRAVRRLHRRRYGVVLPTDGGMARGYGHLTLLHALGLMAAARVLGMPATFHRRPCPSVARHFTSAFFRLVER